MKKNIIFILIFAIIITGWTANRHFQRKQTEKIVRQNAKPEELNLTFIEGWSVSEMASFLEDKNLVRAEDFINTAKKINVDSYPLLAFRPQNADLEGYLFPDTYRIFKPQAQPDPNLAEEIISKMLGNFTLKFTPEMEKQAEKRGMSVYQILTLASIIEKEAGGTGINKAELDAQRKIVAGIFYNRLSINMALQSDATVNYITKKGDAAASLQDIQIDSAYNTYKYPGLPPGPISNPSLSSIIAALYPQDTNYFYFLHMQPSGEIIYSRTHEEHVSNKQKYLK